MKIENGIPVAPRSASFDTETRRTLLTLKVGQSFQVSNNKERCRYQQMAPRLNIKLVSRKVNGDGFRLWRTK